MFWEEDFCALMITASPYQRESSITAVSFLSKDFALLDLCNKISIFLGSAIVTSILGIVVPGYVKSKSDRYDPANLLLLEATAAEGIVARPLLTRLEMSESRSVLMLPLALPNERRNDQFYEASSSVVATEQIVYQKLEEFRDKWVELSKQMNYSSAHSTMGLIGAIAYFLGYHTANPGPTSPSAWFVTKALAEAKVVQNVSERSVKEAKVEDYLRDYRFQDQDVIHLRPGWRFLAPISFREK